MKIMRTTLLTLSLAGVLGVALPHLAYAQMCDTNFEVISTLKKPTYGFPTVWDADYGEKDRMVQFSGGVAMDEGTVMAYAGKLDEKTFKPLETGLVELNRRGRLMTEKFYPAKNGEQPVDMIKIDNRFIAVSNIRVGTRHDKHVRLSWYDRDGTYKRDQTFFDAAYDYEAQTIVPSVDGKGFVVVTHAVNRKDVKDQYGMLSRYSADGKLVWKRAYRPGVNNMLNGLALTRDQSYLATGTIIMDDGRMAGWILKLAYDGTILWQRTYPRGKYSALNAGAVSPRVTPDGANFFLVTGAAEPKDGNPHAAWVMEVDPQGQPVWQRYFRRTDYTFVGEGIKTLTDGRVITTLNATIDMKPGGHDNDHIRILTLSPRGVIIDDQSYLNGLKAKATDIFENPAGDMMLTATVLKEQKKSEEEFGPEKPLPPDQQAPKPQPLQEGWVMVVPRHDVYDDPCVSRR